MKMRLWYSQFYSEHSAYARRVALEEAGELKMEPVNLS
jgi:hypothetical protein